MEIIYWGLQSFDKIESLQRDLHKKVMQKKVEFSVLAGEHPATITLGIRGTDQDIALNLSSSQPLPVVKTDRGGQATLHSEGQLVIYPIIPIQAFGLGVKDFVCLLEKTTKKCLGSFGVENFIPNEPGQSGVSTTTGKIMSMGLRIDQGISRHGIAINISNDLNLFSRIRACGLKQRPMDKVSHWCEGVTPESFFRVWLEVFLEDLTQGASSSNFMCSVASENQSLLNT